MDGEGGRQLRLSESVLFVLFYRRWRVKVNSKRHSEFGNSREHDTVKHETALPVHRRGPAREIDLLFLAEGTHLLKFSLQFVQEPSQMLVQTLGSIQRAIKRPARIAV